MVLKAQPKRVIYWSKHTRGTSWQYVSLKNMIHSTTFKTFSIFVLLSWASPSLSATLSSNGTEETTEIFGTADSTFWVSRIDSLYMQYGVLEFYMMNFKGQDTMAMLMSLQYSHELNQPRLRFSGDSLIVNRSDTVDNTTYSDLQIILEGFDTTNFRARSIIVNHRRENTSQIHWYSFELKDVQFERGADGSIDLALIDEGLKPRMSSARYRYDYKEAPDQGGFSTAFIIPRDATLNLSLSPHLIKSEVKFTSTHVDASYPQPTLGACYVSRWTEEPLSFMCYAAEGQKVKAPIASDGKTICIDLTYQPSGIYFLASSDGRAIKLIRQ
jgi:hypothetical protein